MLRLIPFLFTLSAAGQAFLTHTDVFRSGAGGYHSYRIPAIVTGADGSLVAFAEARRENRDDPGGGDIDIVTSRSTDSGKTWSPLQVLDDPGQKWAASNPTPLLDRSNGRLWILFNRWEPGFGTERSLPGTGNNQLWARTSDDHGRTWSAPRDLTGVSRDVDHWGAMFPGPGGAVQLRSGRLVAPASMKHDAFTLPGPAGPLVMMRTYVLYSDDHGETWKRGGLTHSLTNENQLVELASGGLLMDARQNTGGHRWNMVSHDGGISWSKAQPGQTVSAVATALERFTLRSAGADRNRLIWTGPVGPGRKHLVVRVSYDEGQTWMNQRDLYGGLAAYSDATMLADGTAGILWERGETDSVQFVTFTRFNREFLEPAGTLIPEIR